MPRPTYRGNDGTTTTVSLWKPHKITFLTPIAVRTVATSTPTRPVSRPPATSVVGSRAVRFAASAVQRRWSLQPARA